MDKQTMNLIMGITKNPHPPINTSIDDMMVEEGLRAPAIKREDSWVLRKTPYEKRLLKEAKRAHKRAGSPSLIIKPFKIH